MSHSLTLAGAHSFVTLHCTHLTLPLLCMCHSPAPRLVKMANMFLQVLRTRLGGDGVTFGSAHMRMEFDLCDPARRK